MQNFRSLKGKALSLVKNGTDPFFEGKQNFENQNIDVELLAEERKNTCMACEFYEDEPIDYLCISDATIPELSNKMCGDCFCTLSYKLRQSIEKCKKWQK